MIPEGEPFPLRKAGFDHVNMVRADTVRIAFDEPSVEGRRVVSPGWAPEVIVVPGLENRGDPTARVVEIRHFDEQIHDRFGAQSRNGRAADMFDAADQVARKARLKIVFFGQKHLRPGRIAGDDHDGIGENPSHFFLQSFRLLHAAHIPACD